MGPCDCCCGASLSSSHNPVLCSDVTELRWTNELQTVNLTPLDLKRRWCPRVLASWQGLPCPRLPVRIPVWERCCTQVSKLLDQHSLLPVSLPPACCEVSLVPVSLPDWVYYPLMLSAVSAWFSVTGPHQSHNCTFTTNGSIKNTN